MSELWQSELTKLPMLPVSYSCLSLWLPVSLLLVTRYTVAHDISGNKSKSGNKSR